MTAEIGAMNRMAVALAADSAVTLGTNAEKIYSSAEKLFQLSAKAPVGIMIYGAADIAGVPWETVIKTYRSKLGERRFDRLRLYATDFFQFLLRNSMFFGPERQSEQAAAWVHAFYLDIRSDLHNSIEQEIAAHGSIDATRVTDMFGEVIRWWERIVMGANLLTTVPQRQTLSKRLGKVIRERRQDVFGSLPVKPGDDRRLYSLAVNGLQRHVFSPRQTGVVFAGFGEEDAFPSLETYSVDGVVLGCPRTWIDQSFTTGGNSTACVVPFAQHEMVYAFMEGIDHALLDRMEQSVETFATDVVEGILQGIAQQAPQIERVIRPDLVAEVKNAVGRLHLEWREGRRAYWSPVIQITSALPKDELAAMAESLVNLTKFRRRVSTDKETVGGPIDVAVISKGDGFVWVKRKHYFEPHLNPRVMARYLGGG